MYKSTPPLPNSQLQPNPLKRTPTETLQGKTSSHPYRRKQVTIAASVPGNPIPIPHPNAIF